MIKIGFDISQLAHNGGVNTYTYNLTKELVKFKDLDLNFFYSSLRKPYSGKLPNVKEYKIPPTILEILLNDSRAVSVDSFIGKVDVFHSSDWIQPKTSAKKVTTYHDLVPILYPQWSDPKIVKVHKKRLQLVEKEVDIVIAVSEATKKDLLRVSKIPEEKIKVVYEGVDDIFRPQAKEKVEEFRKRNNLPENFVLSIKGVGERRNLTNVKKAVGNFDLVVSGETIPWVKREELPLLYSAATVLFYPSFYEGFGLPVLEAMSCGIPVITSNVSSLPEVGGKASLYVDPDNISEMEKTLKSVMLNKSLRQELSQKGIEQASKFSWETCAEKTVAIYKELVK